MITCHSSWHHQASSLALLFQLILTHFAKLRSNEASCPFLPRKIQFRCGFLGSPSWGCSCKRHTLVSLSGREWHLEKKKKHRGSWLRHGLPAVETDTCCTDLSEDFNHNPKCKAQIPSVRHWLAAENQLKMTGIGGK